MNKDNAFHYGSSENFPPLLHKKDSEMNSFLVKNCPVGIIVSIAFSSIKMGVTDINRWLHSHRHSYRYSTVSWYSLRVCYVPGTYHHLLQPSNGRHLGTHRTHLHGLCRKDYVWMTHIAQSIKRSKTGNWDIRFYFRICLYLCCEYRASSFISMGLWFLFCEKCDVD